MKHFLLCLYVFLLIGSVDAQMVTGFTPATGGRGQKISFNIAGSHLSPILDLLLAEPTNQYWIRADSLVVVNDSEITGIFIVPKNIPDDIIFELIVSTQIFGVSRLTNAFEIEGGMALPAIKSVTPSTAGRGDIIKCTINCSDMGFTKYNPESDLNVQLIDSSGAYLINVDSISIVNDSVLQGSFKVKRSIPDTLLNLYIHTSDSYAYTRDAFTINGGEDRVRILSCTPEAAQPGQNIICRITCSGAPFKNYNPYDFIVKMQDSVGFFYMDGISIINDSVIEGNIAIPGYFPEMQMNLTLTTPEGNLFLANALRLYVPKIVSVTPYSLTRGQNVPVTITCSNTSLTSYNIVDIQVFIEDSSSTYLIFFDSISIINDTVMKGILPITKYRANTKLDLFISLPDRSAIMVLLNAFEIKGGVPEPAIVSISPSSGQRKEEVNIMIKTVGTEFTSFASNDFLVSFSSATFSGYMFDSITVVNDTLLIGKFTIPNNLFDSTVLILSLVTPQDVLVLPDAFTILGGPKVPHILSSTPSFGQRSDQLDLTIRCTGTNFTIYDPEHDIKVRYYDDKGAWSRVDSLVIINDSVLKGKLIVSSFHEDSSSLTLQVDVPDESLNLENAFLVKGGKPIPKLLSITPDGVARGEYVEFTITCSGIAFTQPGSKLINVAFTGGALEYNLYPNFTILNDSVVQAIMVIPRYLADETLLDLSLETEEGGHLFLANAFTVMGGDDYGIPSIDSLSPSIVQSGETVDIIVTCKNTVFTTSGIYYIALDEVMVNNWTVIDRTTIKINMPAGSPGYKSLFIWGTSDEVSKDSALLVIPVVNIPQIVNVDPLLLYKGSQVDMTITGANTHFTKVTDVNVYFSNPSNAVIVNTVNVKNDTVIRCNVTVKTGINNESCQMAVYDSIDGTMLYSENILVVNTGITEQDGNSQRLVVYPNPSSGNVYMDMNFSSIHPYRLCVMSLTGSLVYAKTMELSQLGKQTIRINKEEFGLKEGFYFVQMKQDERTYYAKLQIR